MVMTAQHTKHSPGYKQTEVGVIPEDWYVQAFSDVCIKIQDGTHFSPKLGGNDYRYITSRNIRFGFLDISDVDWIDAAEHKSIYKRCDVKYGDLLLTKDGANTGNAALNNLDEEFSLLSSVAFLRFDSKRHVAGYFLQQILSTFGQQQIKEAMSGNAITRLTLEKIKKLRFPVPSFPEQAAIANVLSDTDSLIASLDRLIAKKSDIKQATMQQLLTGKIRLPGFSGEWEVVKLEDVADKNIQWSITGGPFGSNLKAIDYTADGVRIIQLQNIGDGVFHDDYKIYTSQEKADELISCNIHPGEIMLSKMGDPVSRACIVPNNDRRYLMASDCIRLVVNKKCFDKRFVHDYINSIYFRKRAIEASTGSTRQRISLEDLKKLPFVAPPLPEQQAIATILSDMDAEIAALEQKRDKTRALKQGMMQELLTGKTRLI
jgi:type I restriction enzyme, S subunit